MLRLGAAVAKRARRGGAGRRERTLEALRELGWHGKVPSSTSAALRKRQRFEGVGALRDLSAATLKLPALKPPSSELPRSS